MGSSILKNMVYAVIAIFLLSAIPQAAYAQLTKKQEKQLAKAREKEHKQKIKEYKKEGWKLSGSSRSIEVALMEHYAKLSEDGNKEISGEVSQCKSINVCKQFAISNAQNAYAALAGGQVKGLITSMLSANADAPEEEMDKLVAAYKNEITADIRGALEESYAIVRDNGATKEYKVFFIVNEEKARTARLRAMQKSLKEVKLSAETAGEISKLVEEEVDVD
jgi:hypothetical protein